MVFFIFGKVSSVLSAAIFLENKINDLDKFEKPFYSTILRLSFKKKVGRYCLFVPMDFLSLLLF